VRIQRVDEGDYLVDVARVLTKEEEAAVEEAGKEKKS
jgi:hypothetical protein